MLIALFFHFWMVLATVLIVGGNAQTTVAVLGLLIISFLILSLLSFHLYNNIYGNSNFNNFNGRKKQNDYVLERPNKRIKPTNSKGSRNKRL